MLSNHRLFKLTFNLSTILYIKLSIGIFAKTKHFHIQYVCHRNQHFDDKGHTLCSQTIF